MAVETISVGTLVNRVSFLITNNATAETLLSTEIKWALHTALREFATETEHAGWRTDATFPTVISTKDYALADDFMRMIEPSVKFVADDYRTLEYIPEQDFDNFELARQTATGEPTHYLIRKRTTIRLWPTPSTVRTIAYRYFGHPAKIYDAADGATIDARVSPEFHHTLVWGAIKHLERYVASTPSLNTYIGMWEKALRTAKERSIPVVGVAYQRQSYAPPPSISPSAYPFSTAIINATGL